MGKRWNPLRAAAWGACIGAFLAAVDLLGHTDFATKVHQLGQLACGAAGGAVLFGTAALLRNFAMSR